jgi:hypothetical protein
VTRSQLNWHFTWTGETAPFGRVARNRRCADHAVSRRAARMWPAKAVSAARPGGRSRATNAASCAGLFHRFSPSGRNLPQPPLGVAGIVEKRSVDVKLAGQLGCFHRERLRSAGRSCSRSSSCQVPCPGRRISSSQRRVDLCRAAAVPRAAPCSRPVQSRLLCGAWRAIGRQKAGIEFIM